MNINAKIIKTWIETTSNDHSIKGNLCDDYLIRPLSQLTDDNQSGIAFFNSKQSEKLLPHLSGEKRLIICESSCFESLQSKYLDQLNKYLKDNALLVSSLGGRAGFCELLTFAVGSTHNLFKKTQVEEKNFFTGMNCEIAPNSKIGNGSVIGDYSIIYENVSLGEKFHCGAQSLIGSKLHSYEKNKTNDGWRDFPQIGGLTIGNDVRVGSQTIINCGAIEDTVIGDHCRIGDKVIVGHNVKIGKNVSITAGAVICGSCEIGDNVWIGPGVIIKNKIKIGANSLISTGVTLIEDVPEKTTIYPAPQLSMREFMNLKKTLKS